MKIGGLQEILEALSSFSDAKVGGVVVSDTARILVTRKLLQHSLQKTASLLLDHQNSRKVADSLVTASIFLACFTVRPPSSIGF